jgi:hypothetical protein
MWPRLCSSAAQAVKLDDIMKSNTYAAVLAMLLLVVYPLVNGIETDSAKNIARFIPYQALVYFEQHHGSLALKEFTRSPLGKKIATIDFLKSGTKISVPDSILLPIKEGLSVFAAIKDNKFLHEILGNKLAIAILPPFDSQQHTDIADVKDIKGYLKENTLIVASPRHSAEGLAFFAEKYSNYVDKYSVSSAQYGNHHIKRIRLQDQTFSLVTIEGIFIVSLSEKQLRHCIDIYDAKLPSLAINKDFLAMKKNFKAPDRFFYLSVDNARKFITEKVNDLAFTGKVLFLKELATTVGFTHFGYGSWNKRKRVIDKVLVRYKSDAINNVVKNHIDVEPIHCSMLSLTTENPMAFYWSNTLKLKDLTEYFEKNKELSPLIEKLWSTVARITGKNVEEIFSFLGKEFSIVLEPGAQDEFFAIPLGMVFLRINNVPGFEAVLQEIISEYKFPITVKSHGQVRYSYWTDSPQDGLQPLYGFWEDLFFFGNSSKLLAMIVDKKNADFSLLDNAAIKMLDPGFAEKNNSITYLNNVALLKVLQRWLDLLGMTLAIEDREKAYRVHTVLNEIINPLLDGVSMYEKSSTRSFFTSEMVVIDSITSKKTLKNTLLLKKRIN